MSFREEEVKLKPADLASASQAWDLVMTDISKFPRDLDDNPIIAMPCGKDHTFPVPQNLKRRIRYVLFPAQPNIPADIEIRRDGFDVMIKRGKTSSNAEHPAFIREETRCKLKQLKKNDKHYIYLGGIKRKALKALRDVFNAKTLEQPFAELVEIRSARQKTEYNREKNGVLYTIEYAWDVGEARTFANDLNNIHEVELEIKKAVHVRKGVNALEYPELCGMDQNDFDEMCEDILEQEKRYFEAEFGFTPVYVSKVSESVDLITPVLKTDAGLAAARSIVETGFKVHKNLKPEVCNHG